MAAIRIVLADDHELFDPGLEPLLERPGFVQVVGRARTGREAVELVDRLRPDIVVLDFSMPVTNGIDAAAAIRARHPETRIVVVAGTDAVASTAAATEVDADAVLRKDEDLVLLLDVVLALVDAAQRLVRRRPAAGG